MSVLCNGQNYRCFLSHWHGEREEGTDAGEGTTALKVIRRMILLQGWSTTVNCNYKWKKKKIHFWVNKKTYISDDNHLMVIFVPLLPVHLWIFFLCLFFHFPHSCCTAHTVFDLSSSILFSFGSSLQYILVILSLSYTLVPFHSALLLFTHWPFPSFFHSFVYSLLNLPFRYRFLGLK